MKDVGELGGGGGGGMVSPAHQPRKKRSIFVRW